MEFEVGYDDWLVGDGDRPVVAGRPWRVTLQAEAIDGDETDWWPALGRSERPPSLRVVPDDGRPARHHVVADVGPVHADPHAFSTWVGVEVAGLRIAVPGRHVGRVAGDVILRHDTYLIEPRALRAYATQVVDVVGLTHRVGRYRPVPWPPGGHELVGWEAPVEVASTRSRLPRHVPGHFVVTCRTR